MYATEGAQTSDDIRLLLDARFMDVHLANNHTITVTLDRLCVSGFLFSFAVAYTEESVGGM